MTIRKQIVFVLFLSISAIYACTKDDVNTPSTSDAELNLPEKPYDYAGLYLPNHFTTNTPGSPLPTSINGTDNTPADNPITNAGATLGRVLFYDKKLSANGTISCGSCHKQDKGFSDDAVLSMGFEGGSTGRHSMTLINARFYQIVGSSFSLCNNSRLTKKVTHRSE